MAASMKGIVNIAPYTNPRSTHYELQ